MAQFCVFFQSIVIAVAVAIITVLVIIVFGIWKIRTKGTVKLLIIRAPEKITVIIPKFEQCGFSIQYCIKKKQTELQTVKTLIREQSEMKWVYTVCLDLF